MKEQLYPTDRTEVTAAGHIVFDGIDLARMAQEYPTPFYLLSENILRTNYQKLVAAFSAAPGFRTYFSVKTNYESGVLRTLRDLGSGAEISGGLDFEAVRRAGFRPQDVVFDGPCKSEEDLRDAIDFGVDIVNIESEIELKMIDQMAAERGRVVRIGMRIDPIIKNPVYGSLIATYKQKFGFPVDRCKPIFEEARRCRNVQVVGLHAHIGSQILSPELYVKNLGVLVELASQLKASGLAIEQINIGGGFPAQSVRHLRVSRRVKGARILERFKLLEAQVPGIADFGSTITAGYKAACERFNVRPTLTAEPGRSLVSNIGLIVGRVRVVKGAWVFSDISINDVPENLFFSEFRVFYPNRAHDPRVQSVHLSGPTLATNDVVSFEVPAPELRRGDLIAIFDTGAYSISRANQFTRPRSGVHWVRRDGRLTTIRRRETVDDVMRMQVWDDGVESEAAEPAAVVTGLRA